MNFLMLFIILNVTNVIIQTVKSLCTHKCGKTIAAVVNAIAYGLYTVVLVYMNCDIPLWQKIMVVSAANFVGVFIVKYIEEKMRKERLWKIEFTVKNDNVGSGDHDPIGVISTLENKHISHNYTIVGSHTVFSCYCTTKQESKIVKEIIELYGGKYFASEGKIL